ncbi:hypothetical protein DNTS_023889 [Danionella cerebrum]|uniref:Ig-like domain-containing protein n=1 Tax=Danionella cerebrum TaxID=2873325 RepID=A0A553MUW1_9TELE|nr:hypothetical protein DNTS_023889 [Danionella translucida]TRY56958.1 hypothetical protein DNTS_023889 [Danionella translucida]TRY56959.1 hypothetical protein DNTS_023889 [Danionella translucida]
MIDRWRGGLVALLVLLIGHIVTALEVPLDRTYHKHHHNTLTVLPQPPTITHTSPKDFIIDPRENIVIHCEAKGKPLPSFSWTRNGTHFSVDQDPKVIMKPHSGTLVIDISGGEKAEAYEGVYQCAAHNQLGTALSHRITIRQSRSPLWSKERFSPVLVQKGQSLVLPCRPPAGLPPPIVFWMDNNFQRLPQSPRVSQGLNGDLFFSNVQMEDSRSNYICYARFPHTQTIQQKQPISVHVLDLDSLNDTMADYFNDTDWFSGRWPTPVVAWTKRSSEIPSARASLLNFNKTLRITEISEADAGEYHCRASNPHGSVQHTFRVTVRAAPYWISAPKNLILAPLETGAISCLAGGNPKPSIQWSINGLPVQGVFV